MTTSRIITRTLTIAALIGAGGIVAIGQQQPQQQKPPVFRAGVNLVQVDAYPTRDGRIVEDLTAADFEVREDGKPQAIENVEFIRIEPNTATAERRDPNTQEEGNALAADPRNRVFVIYLDHYHVGLDGSHRTRQPLVSMLDRMLTATDLFGVMTPLLGPRDLILGRKTQTLQEQLARHWTWGERRVGAQRITLEPQEQAFAMCYGLDVAEDLAGRSRQDRVIQGLKALAAHLGGLREARKVLLLFTSGWRMYRPGTPSFLSPSRPGVGTSLGGTLTTEPPPGYANTSRCTSEAMRLYAIDTDDEIRDLLQIANRNNVSFYPINPSGLEAADTTGSGSMIQQWDDIRDRWQLLLTLAENTDGIAVGSNDMAADLRRVADDVSAYYVLSYYSTNTNRDGKYRRIEVKTRAQGISVKARRGYMAPDDAPRSASGPPPSASSTTDDEVKTALGALTRIRPAVELFTVASRTAAALTVVAELPADMLFNGQWKGGAAVEVKVTDAAGAEVGTGTARIEPPSRGATVVVPIADASAPLVVATRVSNETQSLADRLEVSPHQSSLIGTPVLYRARPPATAPLHPAADPQFRRTERLHVEWPVSGTLDQRQARLLGRNGAPLPIPLTLTERDGKLALDLNLAPLTDGDYLLELTAGGGGRSVRKLTAVRVVR
jgi:VWFA-related protein